jgi:hypothetical protein
MDPDEKKAVAEVLLQGRTEGDAIIDAWCRQRCGVFCSLG